MSYQLSIAINDRYFSGLTWALNSVLILLSVIVSFAIAEFSYRFYTYQTYLSGAFPIDIVSGRENFYTKDTIKSGFGMYAPNRDFVWQKLDDQGDVVIDTSFRHNNYGWRSNTDYVAKKDATTYRIAVIGDSFVASHLSKAFWVDKFKQSLEPQIKAAFPEIVNLEVYAFGVDGAGMKYFTMMYCRAVREFNPDLVIVNFIAQALARRSKPVSSCEETTAQLGTNSSNRDWPIVEIRPGVQIFLNCSAPPLRLDNPLCRPSNLLLSEDPTFATDPQKTRQVRAQIGDAIALNNTLRARHSLILRELVQRLGFQSDVLDPDRSVKSDTRHAVESLAPLIEDGIPIVVLRAPTHVDLRDNGFLDQSFPETISALPGVDYVDLRSESLKLVNQRGLTGYDVEQYMFNLPHDGHFSNTGSEIYGQAAAALLGPVVKQKIRMNKTK